jgi:hypothetical protein
MSPETSINLEVQNVASRDQQLDRAAHLLATRALDCGILVTRHSFRSFTVSLSRDVEYGIIQELDLL